MLNKDICFMCFRKSVFHWNTLRTSKGPVKEYLFAIPCFDIALDCSEKPTDDEIKDMIDRHLKYFDIDKCCFIVEHTVNVK